MDFARLLDELSRFLESRDYPWALVGALALASHGIYRTTLDLDLLTIREAQDDVVEYLERHGFATLHRSAGFSNHAHPSRGRVDFLYVDGGTRKKLFAEIRRLPGPRGREVPVPKPEHLAAMKIQAMKNDPSRTFQDLADIRHLMGLPGVDLAEIRRQFERHGLLERYEEINDSL